MEGYMIRIPLEACFPDSRPIWRQNCDANSPVHSRVLYYVLEEGYLRGYESPSNVNDPIESFQLTGHRIEVNTMTSHKILEIKGQIVNPCPPQQVVEDTSSSDSSDDDSERSTTKRGASAASCTSSQPTVLSSPGVICNKYHAVFFAATTDLIKEWSVMLLNWKRNVFKHFAGFDDAALKQTEMDILHALLEANGANRFLRPIQVLATLQTDKLTAEIPATSLIVIDKVSIDPAVPIDDVSTLAKDSHKLSPTTRSISTSAIDLAVVEKASDLSTQPSNVWWISPFGRSRKILSHSLQRN